MTIREVIVASLDGDQFSVEIFGRTDAQVAKAWEAEQKYAHGKSTAELIQHRDFTLLIATDTRRRMPVVDEISNFRPWSGRPILTLVH